MSPMQTPTEPHNTMELSRIAMPGEAPALVWQGGRDGPPLVLLHGGWGGAQLHWSRVWNEMCKQQRVIAPELPGIATDPAQAWPDYASYVEWLDRLLGQLGVEQALVVGNSFGATLAWLLALRHPVRCRGLVLVDGFPPPELPAWVRQALRLPPLRRMALGHMRRHVYGPRALTAAFHDAALVPPALRETLEHPDDRIVDTMLTIVMNSRRPQGTPPQPALLIWGREDRLPNAQLAVGQALQRGWPGCRLEVIDQAGHLPQVEQPDVFLAALLRFATATGAASRAGRGGCPAAGRAPAGLA